MEGASKNAVTSQRVQAESSQLFKEMPIDDLRAVRAGGRAEFMQMCSNKDGRGSESKK